MIRPARNGWFLCFGVKPAGWGKRNDDFTLLLFDFFILSLRPFCSLIRHVIILLVQALKLGEKWLHIMDFDYILC